MLKTPIARGVALATLGATLAIPTMAKPPSSKTPRLAWNCVTSISTVISAKFQTPLTAKRKSGHRDSCCASNPVIPKALSVSVSMHSVCWASSDSGGGRTGSGLLPADGDGSADDYSMLGLAAKAKVSETVLKIGTLQPKNMAISSSDSRLLPQTFQGAQIVSKDIQGLTLDAGYLNRANHRNSSNNEALAYGGKGAAVGETGIDSSDVDDFMFAGGSYKLTDDLTASYYYSNLEEVYKQHSTNLVHVLPLGDKQSLKPICVMPAPRKMALRMLTTAR